MKRDSLLRHLGGTAALFGEKAKSTRDGRTPRRVTRKRFPGTSRSRTCWQSESAADFGFPIHRDSLIESAIAVLWVLFPFERTLKWLERRFRSLDGQHSGAGLYAERCREPKGFLYQMRMQRLRRQH